MIRSHTRHPFLSWRHMEYVSTIISALALITSVAAVVVALYVHIDDVKPVVMAYIACDVDSGCISFVVENFGKSVARNVRIDGFKPEKMCAEPFRELAGKSFIARGIPNLVPGANRQTVIATTGYAKQIGDDAAVTVTYARHIPLFGWREEDAEFRLDFYSFANTTHTKSDMRSIAEAVKKIAGE